MAANDGSILQHTSSIYISPANTIGGSMRYARVKDVGSRLTSGEQRNKRIIEIAEPLPEGNYLSGRAIYWFVTTEEIELSFHCTNLFQWKESAYITDKHGVGNYLTQIQFLKNKHGVIEFRFPNGHSEYVTCYSKPSNPNRRIKVKSINNENDAMQQEEEAQSPKLLFEPEEVHPLGDPNQHHTPYEASFNNNNIVIQSPPQILNNGILVPSDEALVVNILLLVPDASECIQVLENALTENEFLKVVSSVHQQQLYSRIDSTDKHLHVLVLPYGKVGRYRRIVDYLKYSSEVIMLIEDEDDATDHLMAIEHVANISNEPDNNWAFTVKTASFKKVTLDYTTLNSAVQPLFLVEELCEKSKGGAICKKMSLTGASLSKYILEWTLRPVTRHVVQNIYMCFKYEPKTVRSFTYYAAISLTALGIDHNFEEFHVAHGSVLVYIRCPVYILWYIMMRKDKVFNALADLGLTEIYECFISDVDTSLQRPENKHILDDLTFLKEQMLSDEVPEHPTQSRFIIKQSDIKLHNSDSYKELRATCEELEGVGLSNDKITQLQQENGEQQQSVQIIQEAVTKHQNAKLSAKLPMQEEVKKKQNIDLLNQEISLLHQENEDLKKQLSKYMVEEPLIPPDFYDKAPSTPVIMSQPMYTLPPGTVNTGYNPGVTSPGVFQQQTYVQQVVTPGQPVPGSVIPQPMHTHMKWIVEKCEEFNQSIYSNKDMNITQMIQILYDLLAKWEEYFVEYQSYGEMLAAESEFLNLQQLCTEKTLKLMSTMKKIKSGVKPYSGSRRLKEMAKKLKGIITIKGGKKSSDMARVARIKAVVNYVQNDIVNVMRKEPSSPQLPIAHSNTNIGFLNPSMQVPTPMPNMQPMMATTPMMATNNACILCRIPLAPGATFCPGCGTRQVQQQPVVKFCTKCGTQGAGNFCSGCGSPM